MDDAHYFSSPAEFGDWLAQNHATSSEVWIGYWKKATGKQTLTWAQAAPATLETAEEARFRVDEAAWAFWEARAPSYRKAALHHVTSAKQAATRERRLAQLISDCGSGELLKHLRPRR